ncbi:S1 RNA-binding domain-containing protein [Streptomyces sp. MAI_2237]
MFVALDDGPAHPVFPGVGFISFAELSWQSSEAASDVVQVGQRVSCEFLQFDTRNLEARLSLKAMRPDPFQVFADTVTVGQELPGEVTKLIPFGVFVRVADGIEGLVHLRELAWTPVETPSLILRGYPRLQPGRETHPETALTCILERTFLLLDVLTDHGARCTAARGCDVGTGPEH